MKTPLTPICLALALTAASGSASTLIFADNFNAGNEPSLDDSSQAGRKSGLLADAIQVRSSGTQHTINNDQLVINRTGAGSGRIRFHDYDGDGNPITGGHGVGWHDFATGTAGQAILNGGGFRASFDWLPVNNTDTNWISWNVGFVAVGAEPGTRVNNPETDFGILFRNNGGVQYFKNGPAVEELPADTFDVSTIDIRHVEIEFRFDSFADGSDVSVFAWVDGTQVLADHTFEWAGNSGSLFMEAGSLFNGNRLDNFQITAIPEPSAALFAGLAGLAGLRRRRR